MHEIMLKLFTTFAAAYTKVKKLEIFRAAVVVYIKAWRVAAKVYEKKIIRLKWKH